MQKSCQVSYDSTIIFKTLMVQNLNPPRTPCNYQNNNNNKQVTLCPLNRLKFSPKKIHCPLPNSWSLLMFISLHSLCGLSPYKP